MCVLGRCGYWCSREVCLCQTLIGCLRLIQASLMGGTEGVSLMLSFTGLLLMSTVMFSCEAVDQPPPVHTSSLYTAASTATNVAVYINTQGLPCLHHHQHHATIYCNRVGRKYLKGLIIPFMHRNCAKGFDIWH